MILRDGGLLEDLYEGMHLQPSWQKFLENLRAQTRARFTSLTIRAFDRDIVIRRYAGMESPEHLHRLFIEKFAWDPRA